MLDLEILISLLEEEEHLNEHDGRQKRDLLNRLKQYASDTSQDTEDSDE